MLSFGQRLKALRREADFSQSDLAEAIGVSVQSVSKWECDSNMPDVSLIIPLSAVLGVTADCLLGAGTNEKEDREALKKEVEEIWEKHNWRNYENNAHYLTYKAEKEYLKKYPLDYEVKLDSATYLSSFLYLSRIRKNYEIPHEEFDTLWNEGVKSLKSIIGKDKDPSRLVRAHWTLVNYYTMKSMWDEAAETAEKLPDVFGYDVRSDALYDIAYEKHDYPEAEKLTQKTAFGKTTMFLQSLWYRARQISIFGNVRKAEAIAAWEDAVKAAEVCLEIFGGKGFQEYYLMSGYIIDPLQNMSCDFLAVDDVPSALDCCEKITDVCERIYEAFDRLPSSSDEDLKKAEYSKEGLLRSFRNNLHGCYDWVYDYDDNVLTREERFTACKARIDALE